MTNNIRISRVINNLLVWAIENGVGIKVKTVEDSITVHSHFKVTLWKESYTITRLFSIFDLMVTKVDTVELTLRKAIEELEKCKEAEQE